MASLHPEVNDPGTTSTSLGPAHGVDAHGDPVPGEPGTTEAVEHGRVRRPARSRLAAIEASVPEIVIWCLYGVAAWRNKWISDDGYIYFAYVRNLTENGWGPVLNRGEWVEGFTSPVWYAILSIVNLVRPDAVFDLRQAVLALSLVLSLTAAAAWIRVETLATRLDRDDGADARSTVDDSARPRGLRLAHGRLNLPLAFVAGWYPLQSFATSGLETPLQLVVLMAVIVYVWSGTTNDWIAGALAGLLPLVRPELGLLAVLLIGRHWFGSRRPRSVAIVLSLFALPTILSIVVRVQLYGQLLPNTFYTKTSTGHGVGSGLEYVRDTSRAYGLHWIAAAALLVVVLPFLAGQSSLGPAWRCRAWFLGSSIAMGLYTIVVGGDFMHARFLLTSVVLMIAVFAGLGSTAVERIGRDVRHRFVLASTVTALVFLVIASTESVQRTVTPDDAERAALIGDIADEQYSYLHRNPGLHEWSQSSVDPWTVRGEAVRELAAELGGELGVTSGGIGQITYAGQASEGMVYVYDVYGLTRLDIAHLDMLGADLRVGHAKRAPDVLIAANSRVDFHTPYFESWADVASVRFDGTRFVLVNLDLIDPLVEHDVLSQEDADNLRAWILERLQGPTIDRNFVTFLTLRYHTEDAVLERVRELADLDRTSAWRRWLDATGTARALLDTDGCRDLGLADCWERAIDRHRTGQLPTLRNRPDPVDVS